MTDYVTKDSGDRENFSSGAMRDISTGKPRYDLIPLKALRRWAELMERGATKYEARNWEKGMNSSRMAESGLRHLFQWLEGDRSEDHLAGALFNIGGMIHFEGTEWDDLTPEPEYVEWVLEVDPVDADNAEYFEQELQPVDPTQYINWDKLKQDVDAGKEDRSQINWPADHPYAEG